jgi:hypothetical protein
MEGPVTGAYFLRSLDWSGLTDQQKRARMLAILGQPTKTEGQTDRPDGQDEGNQPDGSVDPDGDAQR